MRITLIAFQLLCVSQNGDWLARLDLVYNQKPYRFGVNIDASMPFVDHFDYKIACTEDVAFASAHIGHLRRAAIT